MEIEQARQKIESSIKRRGFVIRYRNSMTGSVWYEKKICEIPFAKTRKSLYLLCHEFYHTLRKKKEKTFINEFKAEKFAHRYMRHLGFSVPSSQTKRAKRYVSWKITKACRRGLRQERIPKEVLKWLK